jgi:hypothetical protein
MMKRLLLVVPLLLVSSLGFFGKSKEPAKVRVAHFSSDAPAVEVMVDGKAEFNSISYQTITPYKEVANGKVHIQIVPVDKKEQVLASITAKLKGEKAYTIVINGLDKNKDVAVLDLADEQKVDQAKAKVRFVLLSADTPKSEVLDGKGDVVFKNVEFRKPTGYEKLAPGDYTLELVAKVKKDKKVKKEKKEIKEIKEMKEETPAPKARVAFKDLKFEAGKNYTVFAIGEMKDKSLTSVYVVDAEGAVKEPAELTPKEEPTPTTQPTTQKAEKKHKTGKSDKSKKTKQNQ